MRHVLAAFALVTAPAAAQAAPNVVLILADDLGFSDIGCYGGEIPTPNLDALAAGGLRFTHFYNAARCCPTRAALLTGLYPHRAGVGHMLQDWGRPGYTAGIGPHTVTLAEVLRAADYRCYHVGKWHVGGFGKAKGPAANHPMDRGFHRAYGMGGGGNYFAPAGLYLDRAAAPPPGPDYYATDAFSESAARFVDEHARDHAGAPFFLHLCYTAPHFPLHAPAADIARHRGKYRDGWDALRERRFARQKVLGIVPRDAVLPPRDPEALAWADVPAAERDGWDERMAVHAAMIDRMDRGVGRVMDAVRRAGVEENTLVVFLSDNGASAEFMDTWPAAARGHRPGSAVGSRESHRCLEVGWANAANTPFREHKMWAHEGGIGTPFVVRWPAGVAARGTTTPAVGHVIDLMPTLAEVCGAAYPSRFAGRDIAPVDGVSLAPVFRGRALADRVLGWEHEGNRAVRHGMWKLVARYRGEWELYDLDADRTETRNLAAGQPDRVRALAAEWQRWADRVGVVPWAELPGANYAPSATYRKKSERP